MPIQELNAVRSAHPNALLAQTTLLVSLVCWQLILFAKGLALMKQGSLRVDTTHTTTLEPQSVELVPPHAPSAADQPLLALHAQEPLTVMMEDA